MTARSTVPGLSSRAPWGLLPEFHRRPLHLLMRAASAGRPLASLAFGPWTLYLASGEEAVEAVLRPHKDHFKKGPGMEASNPLLGEGLLLSEGDVWKRERRAIHPAFASRELRVYRPAMERWIPALVGALPDRGRLEAGGFGRMVALRVALAALFAVEPADAELDRLSQATGAIMEHFHRRARSVWRPPYRWPALFNRTYHEAGEVLQGFVDPLLTLPPSTPLLAALADDPVYAEGRRSAEALTFLIAGHETTGNAIAWTLGLIARHPGWQDRLAEEVLGTPGRPRVAEAIIRESLRLYPPVWLLSRTATVPVEVTGRSFASGTHFLVSPWVTHRLPEYYEDPEGFRPERWLDRQATPPYRYLAFGGGPRHCPGEGFALTELALVVRAMVGRFRITLPDAWPDPRPGMTLAPADPLVLGLEPR